MADKVMFTRQVSSIVCSPRDTCRAALLNTAVVLLWSGCLSLPVLAADVIPPQVQPRIEAPVLKPQLPSEETEVPTIETEETEAPPGAEEAFFELKNVTVQGSTVYTPDELAQVYQGNVGKRISVATVYDIADAIERKYRAEGYLLTQVTVPPQSIEGGAVSLRVIEGYVSGVQIEGDVGAVSDRIKAYLQQAIGHRPVRDQDLERYLLLVNDLPGVRGTAIVRPAEKGTGAAELVIQANRKWYDGYAVFNNRGSEFSGPVRDSLVVHSNSWTSFGEQIEASFFNTAFTDEQLYGQLGYQQLLGNDGLTLRLLAGYGNANPGFTTQALNLSIDTFRFDAGLVYPVIRSRQQNLYVSTTFQIFNSEVRTGSTQISSDELRLLNFDAAYDFRDGFAGQSLVGVTLRHGFKGKTERAASATDDLPATRSGETEFTTANVRLSRYQGITDVLGLLLSANGQYAFDPLLADVANRAGGEQFGRGYDPSEIAGDHGLGLTAEFQYNKANPLPFIDNTQVYAFYDAGLIWDRSRTVNGRRVNGNDASLTSTGFGLRNRVFKDFFVDLEAAFPLTRPVATQGNKDPRFFFQLVWRF